MNAETNSLTISRAEAIVLFEFLSRFTNDDSLGIEASAEEKILWQLHGQLEKSLVEPFSDKWNEILESARKTVDASY